MDDKEPKKDEGWKRNARFAIYPMAGFYLLVMAYNLFKAISSSKGNDQLIMIVFTILFTIIGLAMIIWGITAGYKHEKDKYNAVDEESKEE